jgi:hypothetical protein
MDTSCVGDKDRIGAANEQAAFDYPDDMPNALLQSSRIADPIEVAIENAVATVGDKGLVCRRHAQTNVGAEHFKRLSGCLEPEGDDFHRDCSLCTEPIYKLGSVNNDCEAVACGGNDLLTQQGATQSFDQIKSALLDLVRPVDCEVDLSMFGERSKRDAGSGGLRCRTLRGRNTYKAQPLAMAPGQRLDCKRRRRAGAKPDDHVLPNQFHRSLGSFAL